MERVYVLCVRLIALEISIRVAFDNYYIETLQSTEQPIHVDNRNNDNSNEFAGFSSIKAVLPRYHWHCVTVCYPANGFVSHAERGWCVCVAPCENSRYPPPVDSIIDGKRAVIQRMPLFGSSGRMH